LALVILIFAAFVESADDPPVDGTVDGSGTTDGTEPSGTTEEEQGPTEEEKCAKLACYVFTEDGTAYNLTPLTKHGDSSEDDYIYPVDNRSTLEWNFCRYLKKTEYFARWISFDFPTKHLTSDQCSPDAVETVVKNDNIIGIKVNHQSLE